MNHKLPIVYHVHTDLKFAVETSSFPNHLFENRYVILSNANNIKCSILDFKIYKNNIFSVNRLIKKMSNATYVVLYDLNPIKSYIANRLPKTVRIFWRFFGYELYRKPYIPDELLFSRYDLPYLEGIKNNKPEKTLRQFLSKLIHTFDPTPKIEFEKAKNRIDYFFCLAKEEYDYLSQFTKLPSCIVIPRTGYLSDTKVVKKCNTIIVGNNRSAYNNHLEVYHLLSQLDKKILEKYNYTLLLNYGNKGEYLHQVIERYSNIATARIIEDFMPIEEFRTLYDTAAALVINGYRQMAMGNIMTALVKGVKVYLNPKNCMYLWAINEGFKVFDVNKLTEDIANDNVYLSEKEAAHNKNVYLSLPQKYSVQVFLDTIEKGKR